jgi:hypothetical protein
MSAGGRHLGNRRWRALRVASPNQSTPEADHEYASAAEAKTALEALSVADHAKLRMIAQSFCKRRVLRTTLAWEELLGEAVVRTLSGDRRWRRGRVSIVRHLDRVMESISGHVAAEQVTARQRFSNVETHLMPNRTGIPAPFQSSSEAAVAAKEEIDGLLRLFARDPEAVRVLECRASGMR